MIHALCWKCGKQGRVVFSCMVAIVVSFRGEVGTDGLFEPEPEPEPKPEPELEDGTIQTEPEPEVPW